MHSLSDSRHGGRRALTLVCLAAIIEGFDLQSAGVAIPKIAPEFGLSGPQIGLFFSAATFGLIFGSFLGGRSADAWGRRNALALSLVTFGIFSMSGLLFLLSHGSSSLNFWYSGSSSSSSPPRPPR